MIHFELIYVKIAISMSRFFFLDVDIYLHEMILIFICNIATQSTKKYLASQEHITFITEYTMNI